MNTGLLSSPTDGNGTAGNNTMQNTFKNSYRPPTQSLSGPDTTNTTQQSGSYMPAKNGCGCNKNVPANRAANNPPPMQKNYPRNPPPVPQNNRTNMPPAAQRNMPPNNPLLMNK